MSSNRILTLYTWAFLAFMFTPLLLMIVASFNDISPPSVTHWNGFTTKWYRFFWMPEAELRADPVLRALDRTRLFGCMANTGTIMAVVVPLSLLLGLSGAVMLTRWQSRANGLLWWLLLSPMLAPGVVLGLSALVFWGRLGVGAGLFTIVIAQTTFIASYAMLILMARLQRQPVIAAQGQCPPCKFTRFHNQATVFQELGLLDHHHGELVQSTCLFHRFSPCAPMDFTVGLANRFSKSRSVYHGAKPKPALPSTIAHL